MLVSTFHQYIFCMKVELRLFLFFIFLFLLNAPLLLSAQETNIFDIAKYGNSNDIIKLLKRGIDINSRNELGETPLMLASEYNNDPDVIITLIKNGA
ncbi:MAG: hypothetical protein DRP58_09200, partial [Spirochaetes bacterium]